MDLSSDAILQQEKGDDEVVKWNELLALQDSLTKKIDKVNDEVSGKIKDLDDNVASEFQNINTSITSLVKSSEAQHNQFDTWQHSMTTMTQQLAALTTLVNSRLPPPEENASASVHNGGMKVPIFSWMLMGEALHNYMAVEVIFLKLGVCPLVMLLKIIERMMVWAELNFLFHNSVLILTMWKSTSGGNLKLRSFGGYMNLLRIRKLSLLLVNLMVMPSNGGIML